MDAISVKTRRWINAAAYVLVVAVNALANALPLFGVKTGDVSRMYGNLFTPAPVTFAIWGVIYALLAGFVLLQAGAFDSAGMRSALVAERSGWWFAAGCVLNAAWLVCWHGRLLGLCVALLAALLVTLAVMSGRMAYFRMGWKEQWLVRAPFSIYFGWITVATIAGIAAWLTQLRWNGWGIAPPVWTMIVLILGVVIALITALRRLDALYALAVAWGFGGVLLRHVRELNGAYPGVIITAGVSAVLLLGAGVWSFRADRRA